MSRYPLPAPYQNVIPRVAVSLPARGASLAVQARGPLPRPGIGEQWEAVADLHNPVENAREWH